MTHPRLAYCLFVCWAAALAALMPRAAQAMGLADEMAAYDIRNIGAAALIALFGGALRTIYSLATDKRVVWDQLRESWRDLLIALMAGGAAYVGLEVARAGFGAKLPFEVRFAALLTAGVLRVSVFKWINRVGGHIADIGADWLTGRARQLLPPADEPPKGTP